MINEVHINFKTLEYEKTFKELYAESIEAVLNAKMIVGKPCCHDHKRYGYILYGSYSRKLLYDVHIRDYDQYGRPIFEEVTIEDKRIQRIMCTKCNDSEDAQEHTHQE